MRPRSPRCATTPICATAPWEFRRRRRSSSPPRGRLLVNTLDYVFADLVRTAGISTAPGVRQPRWHDFRHTFAVSTLLQWYRAGVDVQSRVPQLSTWLGHVDPASTYWYLQASPELLALAAGLLEQSSDG